MGFGVELPGSGGLWAAAGFGGLLRHRGPTDVSFFFGGVIYRACFLALKVVGFCFAN